MLDNARRNLDLLIGRRSAFDAPRVPDREEAAAVRQGLTAWHARAPERYARIFLYAKPLFVQRAERALFAQLASLGLVEKLGASIYQPRVRLFPLYGRFIATDLLTRQEPDQVFSLMFEQVYFVRNFDVRPEDDVLELCLGSGVNSLFAADVARSVTGVDINPRALAFARFNAALGPSPCEIEMHAGSLFEPLDAARRFDTILMNPPFELVPRGETWFLHSDGGEDGLDVVRHMLADVPDRLTPEGRLQLITWSPDTQDGPLLVDAIRAALPEHRVLVHVLDRAPLDAHLEPFRESPAFPAFRQRLAARGIEEVSFLYIHTAPSAVPGVEISSPRAEVETCHALSDPWI